MKFALDEPSYDLVPSPPNLPGWGEHTSAFEQRLESSWAAVTKSAIRAQTWVQHRREIVRNAAWRSLHRRLARQESRATTRDRGREIFEASQGRRWALGARWEAGIPSPPHLPAPRGSDDELAASIDIVAASAAQHFRIWRARMTAAIAGVRRRIGQRLQGLLRTDSDCAQQHDVLARTRPSKRHFYRPTWLRAPQDIPSPRQFPPPKQADDEFSDAIELMGDKVAKALGRCVAQLREWRLAYRGRVAAWINKIIPPEEGGWQGEGTRDRVGDARRAANSRTGDATARLHFPERKYQDDALAEAFSLVGGDVLRRLRRLMDRATLLLRTLGGAVVKLLGRCLSARLREGMLMMWGNSGSSAMVTAQPPSMATTSEIPSPPRLPQPKRFCDGTVWARYEARFLRALLTFAPYFQRAAYCAELLRESAAEWLEERRSRRQGAPSGEKKQLGGERRARDVRGAFGVAKPFRMPPPRPSLGGLMERFEFIAISMVVAISLCFCSFFVLPSHQARHRAEQRAEAKTRLAAGARLGGGIAAAPKTDKDRELLAYSHAYQEGFQGVNGMTWELYRSVARMAMSLNVQGWLLIGVGLLLASALRSSFGAHGP